MRTVLAVVVLAGAIACGGPTTEATASPPRLEWGTGTVTMASGVSSVSVPIQLWWEPPAGSWMEFATIRRSGASGDAAPSPEVEAVGFPLTGSCAPCSYDLVISRGTGTGSWAYGAVFRFDPSTAVTVDVVIE